MRWIVGGAAALLAVVVAGAALVWGVASGRGEPVTATSVSGASEDPAGPYAVWDHNEDGTPVRWDPCTPIEITVATAGGYDGLLDDVEESLDRLRGATGLDLVLTGTTDERPDGRRAAHVSVDGELRWAPVLVAFAAPGEAGLPLRDTDRGVAIPLAVGTPGDRVYVTGQVVLNAERTDLRPGFDDRSDSWGSTVLHELAHIVGLAHVDDPDQLLSTYPGAGPVTWGDGDLAGLAAVGADGGCITAPPAQPVDVLEAP